MKQHLSFLKPDEDWLRKLPEMKDWETGTQDIIMKVTNWIEGSTEQFCTKKWKQNQEDTNGNPVDGFQDESFERRATKLWAVWKLHYETAKQYVKENRISDITLFEIAHNVEQQQGYKGEGKLGGNPFEDILLVDAIEQDDQEAKGYLFTKYQPLANIIYSENEDWWSDFCTEKVLTRQKSTGLPAIVSYEGAAGLSRWINIAARQFLSRYNKKEDVRLKPSVELELLLSVCTEEQHHDYKIYRDGFGDQLPRVEKRIQWLLKKVLPAQNLVWEKKVDQELVQLRKDAYQTSGTSVINERGDKESSLSYLNEKKWSDLDCFGLFGQLLHLAVNSFSAKDVLILKLLFQRNINEDGKEERLTLEEIAQITGYKNKATISKKRKSLLDEELPKQLEEIASRVDQGRFNKCRELLRLPVLMTDFISTLEDVLNGKQGKGEVQ
jgi:hypothetical protein